MFTFSDNGRDGRSNQTFDLDSGTFRRRQHGTFLAVSQKFAQSANFCEKAQNLPPCRRQKFLPDL
jgi:hypothetical protein